MNRLIPRIAIHSLLLTVLVVLPVSAQSLPFRIDQRYTATLQSSATMALIFGPSGFSVGRGRALHSENRSPS